jgi:hypothetical protein
MDEVQIIKNIEKTGFVLEYKVTQILEKSGWNVINNRYYLDDIQPINREIDIIAYKTHKSEDITFYTTLIISCKKSEEHIWSFLTKEANENDPNINYCPIWNWTNDDVLKYKIEKDLEKKIRSLTSTNDTIKFVHGVNDQVFAYQQLDKNTYKPKNDKDIYNSIVTAIKALEYEKNSLDRRIESKALYNFNILSIFEGDMIKVHFDGDKKTVEEIDEIKYLNRLIFSNKEGFYRVHFLKYDKFNSFINTYN